MTAPLTGWGVVVTRTRQQAPDLVDRLLRLGAGVVELPVITIDDPVDGGEALARAAHRLSAGAYQWVAFTSSNAVTRFRAVLDIGEVPAAVRWAAVGSGTARALREAGIEPDLVPGVSVSEALAEEFPAVDPLATGGPDQPFGGIGTVLFPRAETVRGALAQGLRAKGWLVDEVVAYRTVGADPGPDAVALAGRSDAILLTSSSTVDRTLEVLGPDGLPPMIVTIGPVTSRSARAAGLVVAGEASPHTIDGLVDALVATVARGERARRPRSGHEDPRSEQQAQQQQ